MLDVNILTKSILDISKIDYSKSYVAYLSNSNHIIELYLKKEENVCCNFCGSYNVFIRSCRVNPIRASTVISNNTIINVHRRIYKCECGHYFVQENPIWCDSRSISIQKETMILNELRNINSTYSSVAKRYEVSPTYVIDLFDSKVNLKRNKLTQVLCIDEVYSKKLSRYAYCFVIYSPQLHKILDILDSRKKMDLTDYFSRILPSERANVMYISMDLYDNYRSVMKKAFPKAKICADPFHVIKNLTECFQKIRIRVMKNYERLKYEGHNYYWLYKRFWKMLLMDKSKIKDGTIFITKSGMYLDKYQIIDYMLDLNPTLRLAYDLKEEYRNFNATADIGSAFKELCILINKFTEANIPEYSRFISIMKNWFYEIINSFNEINNHRISNGPMERVNADIKTMIRLSFGSNNFLRMRNRIMFAINEDAPMLRNRRKDNYKSKGKERGKYKKT